ncbi:AlpA family transcriptional regulator [uncultured Arthrobacter sp.]|uniref:helix-turn-helix transcriptional regulator n=1 Tax=uncultured Arthrobacter sp. TaxID=114050 RepID=UPI00262DB024|nr:helix-turn-helix domain-containing protein [uncultured Arthrobacter sp.]
MLDLLTPEDLAQRLGMSVAALSQWRYRGVGPKFIKAGKTIRYRVSDVESWMDAQTRQQSGSAVGA